MDKVLLIINGNKHLLVGDVLFRLQFVDFKENMFALNSFDNTINILTTNGNVCQLDYAHVDERIKSIIYETMDVNVKSYLIRHTPLSIVDEFKLAKNNDYMINTEFKFNISSCPWYTIETKITCELLDDSQKVIISTKE